jgi:hypothetical protein
VSEKSIVDKVYDAYNAACAAIIVKLAPDGAWEVCETLSDDRGPEAHVWSTRQRALEYRTLLIVERTLAAVGLPTYFDEMLLCFDERLIPAAIVLAALAATLTPRKQEVTP